MANLPDINTGAINKDDPQAQIDSIVKQINDNNRKVSNEDRTRIRNDDSGTPRLLDGYQENGFTNGNVGVKLSQEGVDVTSATSNQLIWSTDFNSFKIVETGTVTIAPTTVTSGAGAWATNTTLVQVAHNLGYVPTVVAYIDDGIINITIPSTQLGGGTTNPTWIVNFVYTDSVDITFGTELRGFNVPGGFSTNGGTIKYFIIRETAN